MSIYEATPDDQLDDLLILWHNHMSSLKTADGYDRKSSVAGDYKISRQWDDQNGALDAELDLRKVGAVQYAVEQLVDPYRAAIYCLARGLMCGLMAWSSPRLPADDAAREVVLRSARDQMIFRLSRAGVIL